jgi:S-adenosylmethionine synthetase
MSLEAPSGKNPVYHTGKIYTAIGSKIAKQIYEKFGFENTTYLTSQMGGDMKNPWCAAVEINGYAEELPQDVVSQIEQIIKGNLADHQAVTLAIINGQLRVNN